ncbi:MAG: endonuclease domain-containing protein [Sphingomonadaceae bacterium]
MTKPEAMLWQTLRTRPSGFKFRRQHPIGPYMLDFYCPQAKLAIEVDGVAHDMGRNPARDERRDRWLELKGLKILRVPARVVLNDLEAVVTGIVDKCRSVGPSTAAPREARAGGPPPHELRSQGG